MTLYPNPSTIGSSIQLDITDISDGTILQLKVFDIFGKEIGEFKNLIMDKGKSTFSMPLPAGIYSVVAADKYTIYRSTLIIQ